MTKDKLKSLWIGSGNQRSTATKRMPNQETAIFKDVRIFMVFFIAFALYLPWCGAAPLGGSAATTDPNHT